MAKHTRSLVLLAAKDYFSEWQMSGFAILALAAVLGPMMILFGLKFGIIGSMVEKLVKNPHNLEIHSVGSGRYTLEWLEGMRERGDISFIAPQHPSIASTVKLKGKNPSILSVAFLSSGKNDPLLQSAPSPHGDQVVLSVAAAKKLGVEQGDTLSASIARTLYGQKQREHFELSVAAIAPASASERMVAFVDENLAQAISDYRDGKAIPERNWNGGTLSNKAPVYSGFRAYAKQLDDIETLQSVFESEGIDVRTRSRDAGLVRSMDKNLTSIYWVIAIIGLLGYGLSLAASLWSNIDRKKRDLAVLRVIGYRTGDITRFPIIQAMFTGFFGWLAASAVYLGVSSLINYLLANQLEAGESVCRLQPEHFLYALAITLVVAILAAAMAGYKTSRIEPADGLREI
ncbi:MAG: ABC transporter permease [bacterium]